MTNEDYVADLAKRIAKQAELLEDAVIIYRCVRTPSQKFYITDDLGLSPFAKATTHSGVTDEPIPS